MLEAEALIVLRGVELALETGIQPFIVESDSATVVNIMRSRTVVLGGVGIYIDCIISKFDCSSFFDIVFVPKSANMAAHGLAKLALKVIGKLVRWKMFLPILLLSL
ncbi:hypothetical protein ACOSQ2_004554 [Xanthoceras sorbifolium]